MKPFSLTLKNKQGSEVSQRIVDEGSFHFQTEKHTVILNYSDIPNLLI